MLEDHPLETLGPVAVLRFRDGCDRCTKKIALWRDVALRRSLRLQLEEDSELRDCPELWLNGERDSFMTSIDNLAELLDTLYLSYPGFAACC